MITNSTFLNNGKADHAYGGAITIENSDLILHNNIFSNNVAISGAAIAF